MDLPVEQGSRPVAWSRLSACMVALLVLPICLRSQTVQPEDRSHPSQVMGDMRTYRLYLPPAYATASQKRYPVIYWLHGYERSSEQADYGRSIAAYVG